jgi:hypothetical protein
MNIKERYVELEIWIEDLVTRLKRTLCRHEWEVAIPANGPAKYCKKCDTLVNISLVEFLQLFKDDDVYRA